MIAMPSKAASDYLRAIGAAAVYVLADPWGLSRTGVSQHLPRTCDAWRQQHFEPKWAGWVAKLEWGKWLADTPQIFKEVHGNIRVLTWEQVRDMISSAAVSAEQTISDHETTINNAAQMARQVRINMDVLKREGALRPFNTAYKTYNLQCRARRERAIDYGAFEAELFNSVCAIVATGSEPRSETVLAQMRVKFPWLSSVKV